MIFQITPIFFLTPGALSNGGLFVAVQQEVSGSADFYIDGFETALKLISLAVSLTVGLSFSLVLMQPIQQLSKPEGVVFSL